MKLSKLERETVVSYDDSSRSVTVYSASPVVIRRLDRLCAEFPGVYRCISRENDPPAARYEVNEKRFIRFGRPRAPKIINSPSELV